MTEIDGLLFGTVIGLMIVPFFVPFMNRVLDRLFPLD